MISTTINSSAPKGQGDSLPSIAIWDDVSMRDMGQRDVGELNIRDNFTRCRFAE
jgi:hypothetical protein